MNYIKLSKITFCLSSPESAASLSVPDTDWLMSVMTTLSQIVQINAYPK